jgi:ankyrin repeat protein
MQNSILNNALYAAVIADNLGKVRELIEAGAVIDLSTTEGNTAWFMSCDRKVGCGNLLTVQELLNSGVDINTKDIYGCSVLYYAISEENYEMAEFLLRNGAQIEGSSHKVEPLIVLASRNDNIDIVKLLIENEAEVDESSEEGETALLAAVRNQNIDLVEVLISNGANVNLQDQDGKSPLYEANFNNNLQIMEVLLKNGANPEIDSLILPKTDSLNLGHRWNSVLVSACENNDLEKANILLEYGANPNNNNNEYKISALHWACLHGNLPLIKSLLQYGADLKLTDIAGQTPVMTALRKGHTEIYVYLSSLR